VSLLLSPVRNGKARAARARPAPAKEKLLALVAAMGEARLVALVGRMPRPALLMLEAACGLKDCACDVELGPCPCGEPDCDCPVAARILPCRHTPQEFLEIPLAAQIALLWRLHPEEYGEPAAPECPSAVRLDRAMALVMAARRERGEALRHPSDGIGRHTGLEKWGRVVTRKRNGSDVPGRFSADDEIAVLAHA
jgi:hypothetical protein